MCEAVKQIAQKNREEGRAEGSLETNIANVRSLMETMSISAEKAMDSLKISEANRVAIRDRIAQ